MWATFDSRGVLTNLRFDTLWPFQMGYSSPRYFFTVPSAGMLNINIYFLNETSTELQCMNMKKNGTWERDYLTKAKSLGKTKFQGEECHQYLAAFTGEHDVITYVETKNDVILGYEVGSSGRKVYFLGHRPSFQKNHHIAPETYIEPTVVGGCTTAKSDPKMHDVLSKMFFPYL